MGTGFVGALGHVGLAPLLVLENLFPTTPPEVVLPVGGFLVERGDLSFRGALLAPRIGSTAGALLLYAVGRWGGRGLVLRHGGGGCAWARRTSTGPKGASPGKEASP